MRQFLKDESGITMGLAVIMIVLIGVMGAGLLTFVQRDLETVVEVNRGQRAFEMADAGIEAGKRQLLFDSEPERYDGGATADSEWSYSGTGKTLSLVSEQVNVKIRYLTPSATVAQTELPNQAPEVLPSGETRYPSQRDYFKITAQGTNGAANRRVQAIYWTKGDFPIAYFATGNVTFDGNAFSIDDVSVFSEANVIRLHGNRIGGCDKAYGTWNEPPWNSVARSAPVGTYTRDDNSTCTGYPTGVASEGTIDYQTGSTGRPGIRDYDNYDGTGVGTTVRPDFVKNTWATTGANQDSSDISYPFNPNEDSQVDLEALRAAAQSGQNGSVFVRRPPGGTFSIKSTTVDYPANSNLNTVYFVEFANADGSFTITPDGDTGVAKGKVDYASDVADAKGTIVVVNGDVDKVSPSAKTFTGTIIIRDPVDTDTVTMEYVNTGNFDLGGFVNVEGAIKISGSADSATPASVINHRSVGTYKLERWSWRECYGTTNCS